MRVIAKRDLFSLSKKSLFFLIMIFLFFSSCERENIENIQTEISNYDFKSNEDNLIYYFNYKGNLYNEVEWNSRLKSTKNQKFSIIGLNQILYVFDTKEEAVIFEKGDLKTKLLDMQFKSRSSKSTKNGDILLGTAYVTYSINLYDKTNFDGTNYIKYYNNHKVQRWKPNNLLGDFYLTGNEFETNLPIVLRKNISSCQLEFVKGGSVLTSNGGPVYLMCKIYLNAGLIEDNSRLSFVTTLFKGSNSGSSTRNISDFGDFRMWSVFGIPDWDNKIQSLKVKIY